MKVTTENIGCYLVTVSESEQMIITELSGIYDMLCNDIVKMMFSFSSHMAVSRIINEINKSS